jgi:hypothetical protein
MFATSAGRASNRCSEVRSTLHNRLESVGTGGLQSDRLLDLLQPGELTNFRSQPTRQAHQIRACPHSGTTAALRLTTKPKIGET